MIDHAISEGPAERAHGARRERRLARRAIVGALQSAAAYFGFALSAAVVLLAAATLLRG